MSTNTSLSEEIKIFLLEAYEYVDQLEQDLIELEGGSADSELINRAFRAIHTIKGNTGFLGFRNLEQICHRGETVFDHLRSGKLQPSNELVSSLLKMVDAARSSLNFIEAEGKDQTESSPDLIAELDQFAKVNI